jgi:hypothetical protein
MSTEMSDGLVLPAPTYSGYYYRNSFILGSPFPCADVRDLSELGYLTLLAARQTRNESDLCTLGEGISSLGISFWGVRGDEEVLKLESTRISGAGCASVTRLPNRAAVASSRCEREVNGKDESYIEIREVVRDATPNRVRIYRRNLKVHWRGPRVFLNELES